MKRSVKKEELKDLFSAFITEKKLNNLSKSSIRNYEEAFTRLIRESSIKNVEDITQENVNSYIASLISSGMSIASVNHYIRTLKVFFYYLMSKGVIREFKIKQLRAQEEKLKFYSDEELKLLLTSSNNTYTEHRTYTVICFILATGARVGTISKIKLSDVDLTNRVVYYRHLKNKKTAIIPLSSSIVKVLNNFLSSWERTKEDGWLFPMGNEEPSTEDGLRQSMEKYCLKRGIKSKGLHALRHNFAREWVKNNGDVFKLQQMLCHSSLEMTRNYIRLFSSDLSMDIERFCPLDNLTKSREYTVRKLQK